MSDNRPSIPDTPSGLRAKAELPLAGDRPLERATWRPREARRRRKELAALSQNKTAQAHFIQAASHDLKEPLRMVAGFCGLLARHYGAQLDERGREFLAEAVAATGRMQRLLDGLSAYARLDAAEPREWVRLDDVLDEALALLGGLIAGTGAMIVRQTLPTVFAPRARLVSLLQNLLANSLTHTAEGVVPHVRVSAAAEGDVWRVSVADNGVGVAPADQHRIFEPFTRGAGADRRAGAGLGLALCRRIVEDLGGRIWVRSTPGQGSTFNFTVRQGEPG